MSLISWDIKDKFERYGMQQILDECLLIKEGPSIIIGGIGELIWLPDGWDVLLDDYDQDYIYLGVAKTFEQALDTLIANLFAREHNNNRNPLSKQPYGCYREVVCSICIDLWPEPTEEYVFELNGWHKTELHVLNHWQDYQEHAMRHYGYKLVHPSIVERAVEKFRLYRS